MALIRLPKLTSVQIHVLRQMLRIVLTRSLREFIRLGRANPDVHEAEIILRVMNCNDAFVDMDTELQILLTYIANRKQVDGYLPITQQRHAIYLQVAASKYDIDDYPGVSPEAVTAALQPLLQEQPGIITMLKDAAWIAEEDLPRGGAVPTQPGPQFLN